MNKKVLVIEDWDKFIEELAEENQIDWVTALDASLSRRSLPGKLLASFTGDVTKTSDPELEFKSVHVLILEGEKT